MATAKDNRKPQSKGGMDWGSSVRPSVVQRPPDPAPNESHIPWSLLVTVLVLCLVLVIMLPVMAIMYGDMNAATEKAIVETRKMKQLRADILEMMKGE
ncbi:hypothetical protein UFOVP137_11 [uncultured Caudovirales phage]|uniref:Uncharacterized protein n=1 Tax=uncultured Caudovirales phage TaxID=2100421 RepID=A0A6J5LG03_9CAUD|nr:hypothetical protein UFOVP137_11 [uncultured Caudovirales phage]